MAKQAKRRVRKFQRNFRGCGEEDEKQEDEEEEEEEEEDEEEEEEEGFLFKDSFDVLIRREILGSHLLGARLSVCLPARLQVCLFVFLSFCLSLFVFLSS